MVKSYAEILAMQSRLVAVARLVVLMLTVVFLLAVTLLFTSCYDHKELEYGGAADVTVRFDWSRSPEASPRSMSVVAFADDQQPVQFPFASSQGGTFVLPAGLYQFAAFNDDTESLLSSGNTWQGFELQCRPTNLISFSPMFAQTRNIPRAPETENENVVMEPDGLWTSALDYTALVSESNQLTMTMLDAITEYRFVINNVENLSYVNEIAGTLSGMSGGWNPADGKATDTECIIPFSMKIDGTSTVTGTIRTFGHCPSHADATDDDGHAKHKLVLYALLKDGSKYYYTFDISDAMHDQNHVSEGGTGDTTVPIVLEDVPLPKPLVNGSGIHPDVDTWQEVEIPLPM